MPASPRKAADAAPVADAAPPEAQAPVPGEEGAASAPADTPADASGAPVTLTFTGQVRTAVAGVGVCEPGHPYPVSAAAAEALLRGDKPIFARPEAA